MYSKLIVGAMLAGATTFASAAVPTVELIGGNGAHEVRSLVGSDGYFTTQIGNAYGTGKLNQTFQDVYKFHLGSPGDLDSSLTSAVGLKSKSSIVAQGIDFTSLTLSYGGNTVVSDFTTFTPYSTGATKSQLDFSYSNLAAGDYTLTLAGKFLGTNGGSYGGNLNVNVSPVPEPETWSLAVAGLAAVGALARRRQSKSKSV